MISSSDKIISALRLINTPKVGAKTFYRLVDEYGSIEKAVAVLEKESKHKPWTRQRAIDEISEVKRLNAQIILYTDSNYPQMLRDLSDAPPLLYVKGNLNALDYEKSLAIVGSRAASINGRKTASKIAYDLTEGGVCIISGMARGIDTAAHKGAMFAKNKSGPTIAVLGTGIDVVYPAENKEVYEQICQNGCILSEVPLGAPASTQQFPRRNRIVTALSDGVLVVEAGLKSGSLITANIAIDMQKMLFAVPGTPGESRTQGSNLLIKEGATLVENADDILPFLKGNKKVRPLQKTTAIQKILVFENNDVNYIEQKESTGSLVEFLTVGGVYIDEVIRLSGKDASIIAAEILELELEGKIERRAGNKIALIDPN